MKTHRKHQLKKNRTKTILILAFAVIALYTGLWFALAPQLEKERVASEQTRLLESITAGDGVVVLAPSVALAELDFYDESEEEAKAAPNARGASPSGVQQNAASDMDESGESSTVMGIGVLTIDKIDLRLPVVDGVSKKKLKVAVGRVFRTAQIGSIGNAVLAGHRSYEYGKYFNRLDELEVGDTISYQAKDGETMRFEVYDIRTIRPGDQSAFQQPTDRAEITLYTCTPVRIASHRLLIHAKQVSE